MQFHLLTTGGILGKLHCGVGQHTGQRRTYIYLNKNFFLGL